MKLFNSYSTSLLMIITLQNQAAKLIKDAIFLIIYFIHCNS